MSEVEKRGTEAIEALKKALGTALALNTGGSMTDFEDAAKEYVVAQAAFTLTLWSELGSVPQRTVRNFADGFVDDGSLE